MSFVWGSTLLQAQNADGLNYGNEIKAAYLNSKNIQAIAVGNAFQVGFESINPSQKSRISALGISLKAKGLKVYPQLLGYHKMLMLAFAQPKMSPAQQDQFISMLETTVQLYDVKNIVIVLDNLLPIMEKQAFFQSTLFTTSFQSENWTFGFAKEGGDGIPDPSVQVPNTDNTITQPKAEEAWNPAAIEGASNVVSAGYTSTPMPLIEGPYLKLRGAVIKIGNRLDTVIVKNTEGTFMLLNRTWVGKGGDIPWKSAGSAFSEVSAQVKDYFIVSQAGSMWAEGSKISFPGRLKSDAFGILEYRLVTDKKNKKFPKFTSFSNNISLQIGGNLHFKGGFCLSSNVITSECLDGTMSQIESESSLKNGFKVFSRNFILSDSGVHASPSSVIIYINNRQDSITHPAVKFDYVPKTQNFRVFRDIGGFKTTPFFDTYHKLEISSDEIRWNLSGNSMDFNIVKAKGQIPAMFRSYDFFSEKEFAKLQGMYKFHPLRILFYHMKSENTTDLDVNTVATKVKIIPNTFRGAMVELMRLGFVDLDPVSGKIILRPKAYHYMTSYTGKKDYDNMYVPSLEPSLSNGSIDMTDLSMTVHGVEKMFISDTMKVFAYPTNKTVKILKGRDILFDGRVVAGAFNFNGHKFRFDYDSFLVDLKEIDSLKFKLSSKGQSKSKDQQLGNQLTHSSGILYINKSDNKAARKRLPQYPIFDAKTGAIVTFSRKEVLNGVYSNKVCFTIPPFAIDSVKSNNPKTLAFKGVFSSGGIMPDFEEVLRVMEDNSLGFVHKTPMSGIDLYGAKGKIKNEVSISNHGLRAKGELNYLSGVFISEDYLMYEDSLVGFGEMGKINERTIASVNFPDVIVPNFELKWDPKKDTMHILNLKHAFELYKKTANLEGKLLLTPSGLFGEGMLDTRGSAAITAMFRFDKADIEAKSALFMVKSSDPKKPSVSASNSKVSYNLKENYADISPETGGFASLEFPYNQYKTSIKKARWDIGKKKVVMEMGKDDLLRDSYFYSTRPEDDSVVFNGSGAVYDIAKSDLIISGVPHIVIADAKIFPDSGKVTVLEEARIRTLTKARLEIDTLNKYHILDQGKIDVLNRHQFTGSARYRYIDSKLDTFNIIFDQFDTEEKILSRKETQRYTASQGQMDEKEHFYIAPKILFKGKAKMRAISPALIFNGYVKIDIKDKNLTTDWIPYMNDGTSKDIEIDLEPKKKKGKKSLELEPTLDTNQFTEEVPEVDQIKRFTGIHYEAGTNDLYNTFISSKKFEGDEDLFDANGKLLYDTKTNQFKVSSDAKLKGNVYQGNIFTYDDSTNALTYEGLFNFIKKDKSFDLQASGSGKFRSDSNNYKVNVLLSYALKLPPKAVSLMGKDLQEAAKAMGLEDGFGDISSILFKVAEIAGDDAGKKIFQTRTIGNEVSLPALHPRFASTMVLSQVDYTWSHMHKSWFSKGKIGVSNVYKTSINALMKGVSEIKKTSAGDEFYVYLEPSPGTWYYISYQPGKLAALSSNEDFNQAIDAKSKGESGDPAVFTFVTADPAVKAEFLTDFYKHYHNKTFKDESAPRVKKEQQIHSADTVSNISEQMLEPKSKKKKKKQEEVLEPEIEQINTAPVAPENPTADPSINQETPSKKKKKQKEVIEPEIAPNPTADPIPVPESKKKKKQKEIVEPEIAPTPTTPNPTTEPEPSPEPKKKKKKKEEPVLEQLDETKPQEEVKPEEPKTEEEVAPEGKKKGKKKKATEGE